ncbi:Vacuolar protein sorting-associated protein 33A [Rhizophlyctis rosea]|uniref:Vacuolar protein sorting-associated protein 33A n=1 Tax=Rhizophlyctis rosea TaxID=64517 RepID=A0AAD5X6R3_9FUNG|nr:Vacuolar protein sorting-associated protein 33A [Rhizophlyctis rosea]
MNKAHVDQIEELVDKQSPLMSVLRLQCLYSLVEGGIKAKVYDSFRKDIVQTYGYPHILTLQNLARAGILRKQDSSTPKNAYPAIRKAFKLIVDDVNEHKPNDVSYVYSGYAPLSVRLVQIACQKDPLGAAGVTGGGEKTVSWKGWEEPLRLLHGPTFEETQKGDEGVFAKRECQLGIGHAERINNDAFRQSGSTSQQKVTLVVFLGGCTHTEVSALRFLSMQDPLREYVILTTNMTNGSTLLDSLVAKVDTAPLSSGA